MALYHFIGNVALHAGDKKLVILIQGSKPGKINVGPVDDGDGAAGEFEEPRNDKVRGFGVGYLNESRYVPVVVQKGVELDTSFVLAKSCPREKGQTQVHNRRIKRVQLAFEAETLLGGNGAAFGVHVMKHGLEELRRTTLIGIGKCGAFYGSDAQVVKPAGLRSKL